MRTLGIFAAAALIACTGGGGPAEPIDASPVDAPEADTPVVDAPVIDAPVVDAPVVDTPVVDAPDLDAPDLDAPDLDAPDLDAPAIDAPDLDAPAIDAAAIDAIPLDAPVDAPAVSWPPPIVLPPVAELLGPVVCAYFGHDHFGWGASNYQFTYVGFGLDATPLGGAAANATIGCVVGVTHDVHLLFGFMRSGDRLHESHGGGDSPFAFPTDLVAVDPAGGTLVMHYLEPSGPYLLRRLNDDQTLDPTFGDAGALVVGPSIGKRLVQGGLAAPYVTMQIGDQLVRRDVRTGALVGFGQIPLGADPTRLEGLVTAPADGVVLIVRGTTDSTLVLHRLDATGARQVQTIALPLALRMARGDGAGRIVVELAGSIDPVRVMRFEAATGALDPTFGTGGLATVRPQKPPCPPGYVPFASSNPYGGLMGGVLGNGTVVFWSSRACVLDVPGVPVNRSVGAYHLFDGD